MPVRSVLKVLSMVAGAAFVGLLVVSMCATEISRIIAVRVAPAPIALPDGVDIRYSDPLAAFIGRGTPSGRANAITLGYVIIVPERFDRLSSDERRRVIAHELVHVQQRRRYGRLYLPIYGLQYLLRGYMNHPFEREARTIAALQPHRTEKISP